MKYFFARWLHDFMDEPTSFYSEIDEHRYEVRKIEIYRDGRFGIATQEFQYGETELGDQAIPSLAEINEDPKFEAHEISREEFEQEWLHYLPLRAS